jgi:hypothetical protein
MQYLKSTYHLEDRYRWEDNIKMNLKEIWCEDVGWVHPDHDGVK